jgi:hypothetical protein
MASVDALVIGRKTFEKVLTFEAWPYGEPRDVRLRHVATRHYPSGLVQSEYHVAGS